MQSGTFWTLRPYAPADAPAVADLVNAAGAATLGVRRAALDGAGALRLARYVSPDSERVVAVDSGGAPVGYAYLADAEGAVVQQTGGAVHPSVWGRGVGTLLLRWAEGRARERVERAPAGVRALLQAHAFAEERGAHALLARQGFAVAREWLHMQLELDAPPSAPAPPAGLALRPMDLDSDWDAVGPVLEAAFADHWGVVLLPPEPEPEAADEEAEDDGDDTPSDGSFSNAPGLCFVAEEGGAVVGGVLCNARIVERDDTGRLGSLFVLPSHRRRGVGGALALAALDAFWRRGTRRVVLDTDSESLTGAPRFYAAAGWRPFRRELLLEKEIRPGREVRRLAL